MDRGWLDPLRFIFAEVAWPMIAGSLLIATVTAVPTYPIVKRLVMAKRRLPGRPDVALQSTAVPEADPEPEQPS